MYTYTYTYSYADTGFECDTILPLKMSISYLALHPSQKGIKHLYKSSGASKLKKVTLAIENGGRECWKERGRESNKTCIYVYKHFKK